ncbi:MAG TPA: ATP-binding protein [Solirubrobacteraceae bacterium]|nr:ATP-binding protein [Solirubrobacteraceae bacterium]
MSELFTLSLPCNSAAPGTVRDALGQLEWADWVLGDVMLVADELVTNAVLHSGCPPGDPLRVSAHLGPGYVRVIVRDPGLSATEAAPRVTDSDAGGWGLMIVDQLAARWGAERSEGYEVWADVAVPEGSGPAAGAEVRAIDVVHRQPT